MSRKLLLAAASLLFPVAAAHAEHFHCAPPPCHEVHVHYCAPVCVTPARVCYTPAPVCVHPAPVCRTVVTTTTVTTTRVHYAR